MSQPRGQGRPLGRCVLEAAWGRLVSLRPGGCSLRWTEECPGSSAPQCLPWLKPALSTSGRPGGELRGRGSERCPRGVGPRAALEPWLHGFWGRVRVAPVTLLGATCVHGAHDGGKPCSSPGSECGWCSWGAVALISALGPWPRAEPVHSGEKPAPAGPGWVDSVGTRRTAGAAGRPHPHCAVFSPVLLRPW